MSSPFASERTVFLIRHAESTNNVAKQALRRTVCRCRPPRSIDETSQLLSLLRLPMNTPLSRLGLQMIAEQREPCLELARREQIAVILHSPLKRARDTASGLFGDAAPLEVEPLMYEKALSEHAVMRSLRRRVLRFQARLQERRGDSAIAIVGHSAFFRCLVPELGQVTSYHLLLLTDYPLPTTHYSLLTTHY